MTDDSTNSDVLINMKDSRKDDDWYWFLKPGFKSKSDITDYRQRIVKSIIGELKVDENMIFSEFYSSYDESDESLSRGNKTQSQNTIQNCRDTRKCMYQGMEIVYSNH